MPEKQLKVVLSRLGCMNDPRRLRIVLERMSTVRMIECNRRLTINLERCNLQPRRLVVQLERANLLQNQTEIDLARPIEQPRQLVVRLERRRLLPKRLVVRVNQTRTTVQPKRLVVRLERLNLQGRVNDSSGMEEHISAVADEGFERGIINPNGVNDQLPERMQMDDDEANVQNENNNPVRSQSPDDDRFLIDPRLTQEAPAPRRRHADVPRTRTYRHAVVIGNREGAENAVREFGAGRFRVDCNHCGAKYFEGETANRQGVHLSCCQNGDIRLAALGDCPEVLFEYLTEDSPMASGFREQIRTINSLFAMASFSANIPADVNPVGVAGMWCFVISGQVYHHCQAIPAIGDGRDLPNLRNNQYYFIDADEAVNRRVDFVGDRVPRLTLLNVERMLREVNPLIQGYMTVGEVIRERIARDGPGVLANLAVAFKQGINQQRRNFGLPESRSEVAAVFEGDPPFNVDLIIYSRNRVQGEEGRHELKTLNALSDPMTYPLLFPRGERGYESRDLFHIRNRDKKVTIREFYRYRIHTREGFSILHNAGKLFQQYVVDSWVKVESTYLWYLRSMEIQQRSATHEKVREFLERRAAEERARVGFVNILPASFMGGTRHQNRQYLDAMTVIARHGKPDLFITFTCSPRWAELTENLEYRQKYQNRPELICRVFHVRLLEFMDDIVHKQLYGTVLNYFYVIEFQKRGLPHAHILVTFYPEDKLIDADKVDQIVCAEIPDVQAEPVLYGIIAENYVHRVCAPVNMEARCLRDGRCSKGFPKSYRDRTELNYHLATARDGRPEYRRRNDGRSVTIDGRRYTNRNIVPYNRYAALKYRSHINFEGVGTFGSIKYLYKYVTKGEDMCTIEMTEDNGRVINWDEIKHYVDCRYVSSIEAAWRILEFKMSDRSHSVVCLPVHLENRQLIAFHEDEDYRDIMARADKETKLTAYFRLNRDDPDARPLKYCEIPENYVWDNKNGIWNRRRQRTKVLGCIVEVTATDSELFYLRLLLQHVRGATSFQNLRTLADGTVCQSYREACEGLHLLENENIYLEVIQEAVHADFPFRLRRLYALLLLISIDVGEHVLRNVVALWQRFKDDFSQDFLRHGGHNSREIALRQALNDIESILRRNKDDITLTSIGLVDDEAIDRVPSQLPPNNNNDRLTNEDGGGADYNYGDPEERQQFEESLRRYTVARLTPDQREVYDHVIFSVLANQNLLDRQEILDHFEITEFVARQRTLSNAVTSSPTTLFFLDGPAGTGKTFVYNVIIYKFATQQRLHRLKIMPIAYTGIAASLLYQGQTVHRAFRLPLNLDETARAGWPYEHERSREIASVCLILWDEVSMTSRFALEAADRYLRDITLNDAIPFGKKVMLFGGDFRQTLPIVVRGSRSVILAASVKASRLWQHIEKTFKLTTNLRAQNAQNVMNSQGAVDREPLDYALWLQDLGEGKVPHVRVNSVNAPADLIRIPRNTIISDRLRLIEWVYGQMGDLQERVILCPTNVSVDEINREILARLPDRVPVAENNRPEIRRPQQPERPTNTTKTYYSVDKLLSNEEDEFHVPQDMLHAIVASGLPPHELNLKVGAVVILLRNLDISAGMCNGCRFVVRSLMEHLLELEAIYGPNRGRSFWLPRMILKATVPELSRPMQRIQFPVRLAFAMTINKSQGQTFTRVGLHLPTPCFSHGQLYVAFSRVGSSTNIKTNIVNSTVQGCLTYRDGTKLTRNVVYTGIFGSLTDLVRAPIIRTVRNNGAGIRGQVGRGDNDERPRQSQVDNNPPPPPPQPGNADRNRRGNTNNGNDDIDDDDEIENMMMRLDVDQLIGNYRRSNVSRPVRPDQHVVIPGYTVQQLRDRVSTFDRPGTSGLQL